MNQKRLSQLIFVAVLIGTVAFIYYVTNDILLAGGAGAIMFLFYMSGEWFFAFCQKKTRGFVANIGISGHSSIIDDDILRVPSTYEEDVNYICFRPGGSSVY